MKKILFLTHCYPSSKDDNRGIFFRYWIKELISNNINIDVITPSWNKDKKLVIKSGDYGEIIHLFPWNLKIGSLKILNLRDIFSFFYFLLIWKNVIYKINKKNNYDLVIAAWGIPSGLLLSNKSLRNIKKVIWWLGSDYHKFKKGLFKFVLQYLVNIADENWTDTIEIRNGLRKLSNASINHVPNQPISFNSVKGKRINKIPKILSIGRLEKVKNFEFGIRAVKEIINSGINASYEIIGDGTEQEILEREIGDEKNIRLLGFKNKEYINQKLKNIDIFLITSITEGAVNTFFEALAAGKVIVSTDVGDIKKIITNTSLGLTSPQNDLKALVKNLKKAINGELEFDNSAAEKIFTKYSPDISINAALKLVNTN